MPQQTKVEIVSQNKSTKSSELELALGQVTFKEAVKAYKEFLNSPHSYIDVLNINKFSDRQRVLILVGELIHQQIKVGNFKV